MNFFIFALCLLLSNTLLGVNSIQRNNSKTSLIIPCCAKHARHLSLLLRVYEQQAELPDEVVISLSEVNLVSNIILDTLKKELWSFPIRLVISKKKLFAGENRNRACEHATGDILICQDADDLPHPQRIEIIKYFFKTYQVDHLMHEMVVFKQNQSFSYNYYKDFSQIPFCYFDGFTDACYGHFTNGNVAIAKHVFDTVKWIGIMPKAQDVMFNKQVYKNFKHCIGVKVPLYFCFPFLSSWTDTKNQYGSNQVGNQMLALKLGDSATKKYPLTIVQYAEV